MPLKPLPFLDSINNIEAGDAIVCFSKNDIYRLCGLLKETEHSPAVIYGSLPAGLYLIFIRIIWFNNHRLTRTKKCISAALCVFMF